MAVTSIGLREVRNKTLRDAVFFNQTGFAANADRGAKTEIGAYSDMSVQATGTFTGSLALKIQGSNKESPNEANDDDWFTLDDPQGNEISLTAVGGIQIGTIARWVRGAATAGSGGASAQLHFFGRRR